MLEPSGADIEAARLVPLPIDSDEMSNILECPHDGCTATFDASLPLSIQVYADHMRLQHPKKKEPKKVDRSELDTVTTCTGEMSMHSWKVWHDNFWIWKERLLR